MQTNLEPVESVKNTFDQQQLKNIEELDERFKSAIEECGFILITDNYNAAMLEIEFLCETYNRSLIETVRNLTKEVQDLRQELAKFNSSMYD